MSTYITDDREFALISGYRAAMLTPDVSNITGFISMEQMRDSLKEWDVKGIARDGKTIGMAISKDGECHFCIEPEYQGRWLTKSLLKEIDKKIDCRRTTVNIDNKAKQRFVERIGFKMIDAIGDNIVYQLDKLKYAEHRS